VPALGTVLVWCRRPGGGGTENTRGEVLGRGVAEMAGTGLALGVCAAEVRAAEVRAARGWPGGAAAGPLADAAHPAASTLAAAIGAASSTAAERAARRPAC
jgi:hypothetical protein